MDYQRLYQHTFSHLGDLEKLVIECRATAMRLGLTIRWRMKKRTATALIKKDNRIIWQYNYTNDLPHMALCMMYCGVHAELSRREKERNDTIERMRQAEEEHRKQREVINMPNWADRKRA